MSGALAFCALFSLAPLVAIVGIVTGEDAASGQISAATSLSRRFSSEAGKSNRKKWPCARA
jgi:uncharacterized BrkB/YihY/UPF0761 family membrane protein